MLVRAATALVLLAAFLAAVFLLERPYPFALVTGAVICIGAYEWSRLLGIGPSLSLAYVAVCAYLLYGFVATPAILGTLLAVTAAFCGIL